MKTRWNRLSWRLWLALAVLAVGFGVPSFLAQDTNSVSLTNAVTQTEAGDNDEDLAVTEEMAGTNQVSETNDVGQALIPGPDGRTRRLQRQRRNRNRNTYSPQNGTTSSGGTNAPGPLDYSAFRLVTERNIFDPNRQPHSRGERAQPKLLESFTLVGTMVYDKGDFAFFDGSSSDYKKVLKPADTIAGYKVISILPDSVKLEREGKDLDLAVGTQLRRQDDGRWIQAAGAAADIASSSSSNASPADTGPSGADSDVLKRLMQRREKENSP